MAQLGNLIVKGAARFLNKIFCKDIQVSGKIEVINEDGEVSDLKDSMDELKKSVSDGKSAVASTITNNGVSTLSDATFETMVTNIEYLCKLMDEKGQSKAVENTTARESDVLSGCRFSSIHGMHLQGSMPNQGAKRVSLKCGDSYKIPLGYHNGEGSVTANDLKSQTVADAGDYDLVEGKTAWVNGSKVTGKIPIQPSYTSAVSFASDGQDLSNSVYIRINNGAYINNTQIGYPEVMGKIQDMLSGLNIPVISNGVAQNSYVWSGTGGYPQTTGDFLVSWIPYGFYYKWQPDGNGNASYCESWIKLSDVRNAIGLTSDKIMKGVTVCGITGTGVGLKSTSTNKYNISATSLAMDYNMRGVYVDRVGSITNVTSSPYYSLKIPTVSGTIKFIIVDMDQRYKLTISGSTIKTYASSQCIINPSKNVYSWECGTGDHKMSVFATSTNQILNNGYINIYPARPLQTSENTSNVTDSSINIYAYIYYV